MRESRTVAILAYGYLALSILLAAREVIPPRALPEGADPTRFSAGRAMAIVREIASGPRPRGGERHAAAREAIVRRLAQLGLQPEVREHTNRLQVGGDVVLSTVRNVVARIEGTGGGQDAVMLSAHYDTVPMSPGAADDAAGVATLIEAARARIGAGPTGNDILLLFTDGEEEGLLGAQAFVAEDQDARDVRVVLNFEARGSRGASLMFETRGSSQAMAEALGSIPHPVSSSLFDAVYRRMPNDTDLSAFRNSGVAGMNFAFIDGYAHYHSVLDAPESLDAGSLQQHGDAAVALLAHFGDRSLDGLADAEDATWFTAMGLLFGYPAALDLPLGLAAIACCVLALSVGLVRPLRSRSFGVGLLFAPIATGLSAGLALLLTRFLADARAHSGVFDQLAVYAERGLGVGAALFALSIASFVLLQLRSRARAEGLIAGGLAWWAALGAAALIWLPRASYLATWPLFAASAGFVLFARRPRRLRVEPVRAVGVLLLLLPGPLLWLPAAWLVLLALRSDAIWVVAAAVAMVSVLAAPALLLAMAHRRLFLPLLFGFAGALVTGLSLPQARADARRPLSVPLSYEVDAGHRTARLTAPWNVDPDLLPVGFPLASDSADHLAMAVDFADLEAPDVRVERFSGGAVLDLSVSRPAWADELIVRTDTSTATLVSVGAEEQSVPGFRSLRWRASPGRIRLRLADAAGVGSVEVTAMARELPAFADMGLSEWPAHVVGSRHSSTAATWRFPVASD